MDKIVERLTRVVAQRTSRRGFIARLGKLVAGGMIIPLLPVDRAAARTRRRSGSSPKEGISG